MLTDMEEIKWWVLNEDCTISGPYDTESEALAFGDEVFNDNDIESNMSADMN
ncbi:MAG: hypothetical protein MN733_15050 [Nitrososphaera sp.]|nr:hypothetical protein [Nitrososphaera sp.]